MDFDQEQFHKLYDQLPLDLKIILNSSETNDAVSQICEQYGLAEKFPEIINNISLVIVGLLSLEDFKNYIQMVAEQGGVVVYNKIYSVAFAGVEQYLIPENGQTFFGSVPAPLPKKEMVEPESRPPEQDDPYREKTE